MENPYWIYVMPKNKVTCNTNNEKQILYKALNSMHHYRKEWDYGARRIFSSIDNTEALIQMLFKQPYKHLPLS